MKDRMEGPTKLLRRHQPVLKTTDEHGSVLTRKSFAGRKRFFFAKSSRSSRLRGESWAGLSLRTREAREENAKDFSLVAALLLCENGLSWHGRPRPSPRPSGLRPAGPLAVLLAPYIPQRRSGYARRSRLASGPGGQQQNVHLIS